MQPSSHNNSGFLSVVALLGFILFAALAWCMVSSCLGRSCFDAVRELWRMMILSAQSDRRPGRAGYRRHLDDQSDLFEMEYRGAGRAG